MSASLFIDPTLCDKPRPRIGDIIFLPESEEQHAQAVLRIKPGEHIDITDGKGVRYRATAGENNHRFCAYIDDISVETPALQLTLVQALIKGARQENAIEAAVEYGMTSCIPWQAERSIAVWDEKKHEKARAKWEKTVFAATKQSRRAFLSTVEKKVNLSQLSFRVQQWKNEGACVLLCHEESARPLHRVAHEYFLTQEAVSAHAKDDTLASDTPAETSGHIVVIIGPEGGVSPHEVHVLTASGAQTVLLGQNVLRAASAGPFAFAALSTLWHMWSGQNARVLATHTPLEEEQRVEEQGEME